MAAGLLDVVLKTARENGPTTLVTARIRIGAGSCLNPDSLAFGFEALAAGTPASGCGLEIEHLPTPMTCPTCGWEGERLDIAELVCPHCEPHPLRNTRHSRRPRRGKGQGPAGLGSGIGVIFLLPLPPPNHGGSPRHIAEGATTAPSAFGPQAPTTDLIVSGVANGRSHVRFRKGERVMRTLVLVAVLLGFAVLPARAAVYFSEDFEGGTVPTWRNWWCDGLTPNDSGPGFDLTVAGGNSAANGYFGLNLHTDRTSGSVILEPQIGPASGCLEFRFAIRPYVTGEPGNNGQRVYLSEVSMHDQDGPYCLGVTFGSLNGAYRIGAADAAASTVGTYIPGQWCFVTLHLDTATDRFDVVVDGPGVVGGHAALFNAPFVHVLDTVNYVQFWSDGNGSNDFGLDSVVLEDGACPPVPVENTSWGRLKKLYSDR